MNEIKKKIVACFHVRATVVSLERSYSNFQNTVWLNKPDYVDSGL